MGLRVDHGFPEIGVSPELMVLHFVLEVDFLDRCIAVDGEGQRHELCYQGRAFI